MRRTAGLAILALVAFGLAVATPQADAHTKVIRVTKTTDDAPNGCTRHDCSLREAILKANARKHGGTIVLGPATYDLTIAGAGEDAAATGDLDIRRPVKIKGTPGATTIIQHTSDRVLQVVDAGALSMSGVTVTGGNVTGQGGGIEVDPGRRLTLTNVVVTSNHASGGGGGIFAFGASVALARSTVSVNVAGASSGQGGGGIYLEGPGALVLTDSTVDSNTSSSIGGGIQVAQPNATFTLLRSTVSNNTSDGNGGGVLLSTNGAPDSPPFTLSESTISGNQTTAAGGGIFCGCNKEVPMTHVTITNNTVDTDNNAATAQGGGYAASGSAMQVKASIVAGNHDAGQTDQDCGPFNFVSLGYNVVGQASCINPGPSGPNDTTVSGATFLDALGSNGGPTKTHAINDDASAPVDRQVGNGCGGTDQRGVVVPFENGCDSGAYELAFCGTQLVNVVGTNRNDRLTGTVGDDGILAQGGNDRIAAGFGNDSVCGGKGKDKIDGGDGNDTCIGGPGHDKFANCEVKQQN